MVKWIYCPICGCVVDEFETECSECGYERVWEEDKEDE